MIGQFDPIAIAASLQVEGGLVKLILLLWDHWSDVTSPQARVGPVQNSRLHLDARMLWPEIHALLSTVRSLLAVHPLTIETYETGLALAERYNFSTYDAMIVAAAIHAKCDILWSEDMQHGMELGEGLRTVNPFL